MIFYKYPILKLSLLLLTVIIVSNASAKTLDCIKNPIKLAFYEYGYFYYDNGKGIDKDIVDEIARRSGCKFHAEVMTRARIWSDIKTGNLDMSVLAIQTRERDEFAWFVHYLTMKNYAILNKRTTGNIKNAQDFIANPNLQFGVVRSFKHGIEQDKLVDELRRQNRIQESINVETIYKKLKEGRVDGMFSQPPVYKKKLKDLNMQDDIIIQDWAPKEKGVPHGLVFSKGRFNEHDIRVFQRIIDDMRKDGTLKKIYSKYLPLDDVNRLLDF